MANPRIRNVKVRYGKERLYRINIPVPNDALEEWLQGPECYAAVDRVTQEILNAYQAYLPQPGSVSPKGYVRKGKLMKGAYARVALGHDWGRGGPRWFGYIGNKVLYARVIEYGSSKRNIQGQGQLRRAAGEFSGAVAAALGGMADAEGTTTPMMPRGVAFDERAMRYRGARGRFAPNPNKK